MVLRERWRWFLSMLALATTWQSDCRRKLPVLLGPCIPHPTTPMVIRSDGAGRPSAPSALAGIIVGAASTVPVTARKWRRLIRDSEEGFIDKNVARARDDILVQSEEWDSVDLAQHLSMHFVREKIRDLA